MPALRIAIIPVTLFQQNCSLVWEEASRRAVVIDPGGEPGRIVEVIDNMEAKVEKILLTHGHLDHAGGALALKGVLDERGPAVPILGPGEADRFLLDGIEDAQRTYGFSGLRNVTPDAWLADGDVIELGALRFEVLHCPGHTPGHVVFVERTQRIAFVGDVLFEGSVGRTDFPYGDGAMLLNSIRTQLLPLGDDVAFVSGHGPTSTIGAERLHNPFLRGLAR